MSSQPPRPSGVTLLAVLELISGLLSILAGALFMAIYEGMQSYQRSAYRSTYSSGDPFVFLAPLGPLFILSGLFKFLMAWGLWAGRPWAWTLAAVFAAIGLLGIPIGTIISILILYYLTRPHVKAFFGKGPPVPVSTPVGAPATTSPGAYNPPPASAPSFVLCPGCRATIPADAVFCGKCGMDLRPRAPAAPPAPAGPRYCVSCGAAVAPGVRFCPGCGGRVA